MTNPIYQAFTAGMTPVPYTAEQLAEFPHRTAARRAADAAFRAAAQNGESLTQAQYDAIWDAAYEKSHVIPEGWRTIEA